MIRHFFLDKTNTIIENNRQNFGLNPILSISYGDGLTRGLIHFDVEPIKELIRNKTFCDIEKLIFRLKMTNCFSVAGFPYEIEKIHGIDKKGERAASCDLMLFELPCDFDEGCGFDFYNDFWIHDCKSFTTEGSTWKNARSGFPWKSAFEMLENYNERQDPGGIYSLEKLEEEYNNFLEGKKSIVVGTQHFDFGQENLSIDITKYVIDCIEGKHNHGLCLAFTPTYEKMKKDNMFIIDFFNDHTNTFFHPYVEVIYDEYVLDNRQSFTISKENKLYLYVYDDGLPTNLDKLPICKIEEQEFEVKQASKGVYYAIIPPNSIELYKDTMYYDIWSEIVLNGQKMDDVEMEFVALDKSNKILIGNNSNIKKEIVPYVYGINDNEELSRNEIREINVDFREKYNSEKKTIINTSEYRLYIKDGNREINIIDFQPIEVGYLNNFFLLYTEDLIPNKYFIDIKLSTGREMLYFKDVLHFNIINNVTERYQ